MRRLRDRERACVLPVHRAAGISKQPSLVISKLPSLVNRIKEVDGKASGESRSSESCVDDAGDHTRSLTVALLLGPLILLILSEYSSATVRERAVFAARWRMFPVMSDYLC